MKNLLFLRLAAHAALVAACIAPFNNQDFFNHTLLSQYVDEQLVHTPTTGGPAWFSIIAPDAPLVQWPTFLSFVSIKYCYSTPAARYALSTFVEAGAKLWKRQDRQSQQRQRPPSLRLHRSLQTRRLVPLLPRPIWDLGHRQRGRGHR